MVGVALGRKRVRSSLRFVLVVRLIESGKAVLGPDSYTGTYSRARPGSPLGLRTTMEERNTSGDGKGTLYD